MPTQRNEIPDDSADREIVITRVFDAPRQQVFAAFTDPSHISSWWGPRGFRTTTREYTLSPGGVWRFIMHGPDGRDYDNRVQFTEVTPPERIVYLHGSALHEDPNQFKVVATFTEESPQQTRLVFRMIRGTKEQRDEMIRFGAVQGGEQTLERLSEHLANLGAVTKSFVLSREFDAPRDLVFKVWIDREHLVNWWGPKGMKVVACKNDPRPGGTMHYCLRMPAGEELWGRWAYREIVPPERLVFVSSFSDETGGVTHHPLMREWPLELLSTITFAERDGRTTVTVQWSPLNPTDAERNAFDRGHPSMTQGWGGTFDQLGAYLATLTGRQPPPSRLPSNPPAIR